MFSLKDSDFLNLELDTFLDRDPFLLEIHCKSFTNETSEENILALLKPYFGAENFTSLSCYVTNCMIIPGQNKAIIQINDPTFGTFIYENYQVLSKDFPLLYKGNSVSFMRLENHEEEDKLDSEMTTSSSSWNFDNNSIDDIDEILDNVISSEEPIKKKEHNIALYGWTPKNGNDIALNLPGNIVDKIMIESKINNIPAESFCLMLGFLTHDGPISLDNYRLTRNDDKKDEEERDSITSSGDSSRYTIESPKLNVGLKKIESTFKTPVVMINNLNESKISCDRLFAICGVFGDVIRVKISYNKRDTAFVQLVNHEQAKNVIHSLNRCQLYGKIIYVNLSRIKKIKLPKDSPNSTIKYPDRKYLTKNYVNSKKHRFSKKKGGNKLNTALPSNTLYLYNLPNIDMNIINQKLIQFLNGNDKIKTLTIQNENGQITAMIECHNIDFACQIIIDNHLRLFYGNEIKITFASKNNNESCHTPYSNEKKFFPKRKKQNKGKNYLKGRMNMNPNRNGYFGTHYQQQYRKKECC